MRVLAVAVLCAACSGADLDAWRGRVYFFPPEAVSSPRTRAEVAALLRSGAALGALEPRSGSALGAIAVLRAPPSTLQVGAILTEIGDERHKVVFADQIDVDPDAGHVALVLRPPPGARWPGPCRTYALALSGLGGELAEGLIATPGCPRAIEDLRGRVLFHVGRGGPSLHDFPGTLSTYREILGARRVLVVPRGRPFFLGWKAAFPGPAGVARLRARLRERLGRKIVDERALDLDPSWDTLAGGWEVPPGAPWPLPGLTYELTIERGREVLARGELVITRRGRR